MRKLTKEDFLSPKIERFTPNGVVVSGVISGEDIEIEVPLEQWTEIIQEQYLPSLLFEQVYLSEDGGLRKTTRLKTLGQNIQTNMGYDPVRGEFRPMGYFVEKGMERLIDASEMSTKDFQCGDVILAANSGELGAFICVEDAREFLLVADTEEKKLYRKEVQLPDKFFLGIDRGRLVFNGTINPAFEHRKIFSRGTVFRLYPESGIEELLKASQHLYRFLNGDRSRVGSTYRKHIIVTWLELPEGSNMARARDASNLHYLKNPKDPKDQWVYEVRDFGFEEVTTFTREQFLAAMQGETIDLS